MRKKLPNPLLMPNEVLPSHCDANLPSSRAQAYSASNVSSVDTARISNDSTRTPSTTTIFSTPPHRPAANISHNDGQYAPAAVYATECPCPFVYNKQHKLTLVVVAPDRQAEAVGLGAAASRSREPVEQSGLPVEGSRSSRGMHKLCCF